MQWSSPRRGSKSKGHKNRAANFNFSQIRLPSHLTAWPNVRLPDSPTSASKATSSAKPAHNQSPRPTPVNGPQQSIQETCPQKQESTSDTRKKKVALSLSDDEEADSTTTASPGNSQYQSADEDSFAKERSGSNLTRKIDELSSGSDCELSDDEDSDGKVDGSQLTLEDGASERKEVMKDATASQKRDKSTGKKKNRDKGGLENVFNARSPDKEVSGVINIGDTVAPIQTQQQIERKASPVTDFLDSLEETFVPHDAPASNRFSQAPARLSTKFNKTATPKTMPVRSRGTALRQVDPQSMTESERSRGFFVALSEAQRQARLLSRRTHPEFSSKAFESSDDETSKRQAIGESALDARKKKEPKTSVNFNPVEAEVAKQQARLKEHTAKKMKENPERYLKKDKEKAYELTSDGESSENGSYQANLAGVSGRNRDAAASSLSSRENIHEQSVTKKDKKRRKRKHDHKTDQIEEDGHKEKKRKRSEKDMDDQLPQDMAEAEAMLDDFLNNIQTMAAMVAHGKKKKQISTPRRASLKDTLTSLREVDLEETPFPTAQDYHKAKNDAEFSVVLKSLWTLLPKALLYSTMRNLNNANRASLGDKLKLCLKGKQTNPNIRVVKRMNEHGDEIDLLEEYGVISEPDPYTMSSDLTLLTAARSLIVLLSGQRTGLDLSALVDKAIEGKDNLMVAELKQSTQENPGGISPMEVELRRIASERQKEVEQLKKENRVLMTRLNRLK